MSANLSNETTYRIIRECFGDTSWILTMMPASLLIICVLGIILNLLVLIVFCFHKKACTVPEIYLSNLAAADLLLMGSLLFLVVSLIYTYHSALCVVITAININSCCSSGFLVLVSIDRYLALVHPLSHERLRRPICAKLGCLLVWTLGLLLSVHNIIYIEIAHNPWQNATVCTFRFTDMSTILLSYAIFSIFSFFIPLCIMCFCTVKIVNVLRNRVIERSNTQKMEHKATTLVLAVLLVFLICWLPFHMIVLIHVLLSYIPHNYCLYEFISITRWFSILLAFFNSAFNPILYVIVGKTFRTKVKEFFQQCKTITTTTTTSLTSTYTTQTSV
ncbi:B2 bradykinin receptor-like [Parambassis ranga]|uniref:B2 bradykinin receptor-like n=1 Tax=Parambassis ranga TaxID=210632 RepID=A0A6P7JR73_9TELE|nr:B2 bradykinin receptor-like [Parambassis ranga]